MYTKIKVLKVLNYSSVQLQIELKVKSKVKSISNINHVFHWRFLLSPCQHALYHVPVI